MEASIFVTVYGHDSANETVIVVPDAFDTSFSFRETAEAFERFGVRVILFDFPGFGLSSLPMKDGRVVYDDLHTQWLNEVLLSFDHPHVSILAQGTAVVPAALYASEYPQAVETIITFGGSIAARRDALPPLSRLQELLAKMNLAFPRAHTPNGCHDHLQNSDDVDAQRAAAAADTYLVSNDGREQYVHRMRTILFYRPPIDWSERPRDATPRLWIAHSSDAAQSHVHNRQQQQHSTALVESKTDVYSPDICLHRERPRDFSIIILASLRPQLKGRPSNPKSETASAPPAATSSG